MRKLIIVTGIASSGKSTYAKEIATKTNFEILSLDDCKIDDKNHLKRFGYSRRFYFCFLSFLPYCNCKVLIRNGEKFFVPFFMKSRNILVVCKQGGKR